MDDYLTPYPQPDPTEAPMPIPSSKINGLTKSSELVDPDEEPTETPTETSTETPTPTAAAEEYDGPAKTGKTLKDLATELGAPDSFGTLLDEMQDAILGITNDLLYNTGERTSLVDILTHENRLRGLGALFVMVAVLGMLVDSTVGRSLKSD